MDEGWPGRIFAGVVVVRAPVKACKKTRREKENKVKVMRDRSGDVGRWCESRPAMGRGSGSIELGRLGGTRVPFTSALH